MKIRFYLVLSKGSLRKSMKQTKGARDLGSPLLSVCYTQQKIFHWPIEWSILIIFSADFQNATPLFNPFNWTTNRQALVQGICVPHKVYLGKNGIILLLAPEIGYARARTHVCLCIQVLLVHECTCVLVEVSMFQRASLIVLFYNPE